MKLHLSKVATLLYGLYYLVSFDLITAGYTIKNKIIQVVYNLSFPRRVYTYIEYNIGIRYGGMIFHNRSLTLKIFLTMCV